VFIAFISAVPSPLTIKCNGANANDDLGAASREWCNG